jgi:hypothetical protein
MTKIIALCGPAGVGKTTLAELLVKHHNYTRLNFARPIKIMLGALLKWQGASDLQIRRMLDGDLKEEPTGLLDGQTPRRAMQTLGTEWRDLISKNLWVNVWQNTAEQLRAPKIVIDDMRFLHEAQKVKELDGTIIRLERSGFSINMGHLSEHEYMEIQYDFVLVNHTTPIDMLNELATRTSL